MKKFLSLAAMAMMFAGVAQAKKKMTAEEKAAACAKLDKSKKADVRKWKAWGCKDEGAAASAAGTTTTTAPMTSDTTSGSTANTGTTEKK